MWIVLHLGQTQYLEPMSDFTNEIPSPVSTVTCLSIIPQSLNKSRNASSLSFVSALLCIL